ncbi:hypothetical protein GMO_07800 [Gluconobacter morbifer G707]|uniref:Uncharacterized protein n=1 Tax=Gluconobacter morbifer G707 TaxID=1088869 RepID=G6XH15_9PROT|nr:hypothetical protein GMO_07800 [Gluconobacter morbifer G707]
MIELGSTVVSVTNSGTFSVIVVTDLSRVIVQFVRSPMPFRS